MNRDNKNERKRRTAKKAVLLSLLLLLLFAVIALAVPNPGGYPSPFPNREYTHRIPIRFYLNDEIQTKYFGWLQTHTFDLKDQPNTGLTAAMISEVKSVDSNLANNYFEAFHWPRKDGYYLLSADEGSWGDDVPFLDPEFTKYIMGIPQTQTERADSYVLKVGGRKTSDGTKNNPAVFPASNSGPRPAFPADVTWDGTYFAYAKARLPHVAGNDYLEAGWTELTRPQGAKSVAWGTGQNFGYSQVMVSYPHNIFVTALELVELGENKDKWIVAYGNQTPWEVPKAKLRAYVQEEGKEPVLVNESQTLIGSPWSDETPLGNWKFSTPVMPNDFKVIVTINYYWGGNAWNEEPLAVRNLITKI